MSRRHYKRTIGRREKVDFPGLDLYGIDSKVDTGAFTSSLHCTNIESLQKEGRNWVKFNLLDENHADYDHKEFMLPVLARRKVKNSFGQKEMRYVIKTKIVLFGETVETELALTNRHKMDFPVLLGRKLLRGRFLVDVSRANISEKPLKKQRLR